MKNKRILFIAPASIPVNGAEAIVNVKLLKLLVAEGYKIDVISKKAKWEHYPLMQEEKLQSELESVNIIEVDNSFSLKTLWLHLMAWKRFHVAFKGVHWAYLASRVAKQKLSEHNYACVITKNYPSELLGCFLKRKYGLPWVATWNDPYPHERFPEPYGKGPHARLSLLKRPILKQMAIYPDAHIYPSSRLKDYMQSYLNVNPDKVHVIPHIVEGQSGNVSAEKETSCLRVCYIGCLDGPRQPWTTLEAISMFRKASPESRIQIDFIGTYPDGSVEKTKELGISDIVSFNSPVSYKESLELLKKYQVALIIEAPCPEGVFLPSKVSDAMSAGLSVFAVSPANGVLHDLYDSKSIQYFSDVTRPQTIAEEMTRMYGDFLSGKLLDPIVPEEYLPESVARQYENVINGCSR